MSEKNIQELTSDEIKFPNSTKIYVTTNGDTRNSQGQELKVPFREIALSPTRNMQANSKKMLPCGSMIRAAFCPDSPSFRIQKLLRRVSDSASANLEIYPVSKLNALTLFFEV